MIFKIFEESKKGKINYHNFIASLKGELPEKRKIINERIWERVKRTENSTTFSHIKQCVNLRGHPDIYNGKKYEDEIIK